MLPKGYRLAGRSGLKRADLAGEPMPRWAGQADPAAREHDAGPEINDVSQLIDAVTSRKPMEPNGWAHAAHTPGAL